MFDTKYFMKRAELLCEIDKTVVGLPDLISFLDEEKINTVPYPESWRLYAGIKASF